jgi:hypothetical protein
MRRAVQGRARMASRGVENESIQDRFVKTSSNPGASDNSLIFVAISFLTVGRNALTTAIYSGFWLRCGSPFC